LRRDFFIGILAGLGFQKEVRPPAKGRLKDAGRRQDYNVFSFRGEKNSHVITRSGLCRDVVISIHRFATKNYCHTSRRAVRRCVKVSDLLARSAASDL
jgi:hypothetical protein